MNCLFFLFQVAHGDANLTYKYSGVTVPAKPWTSSLNKIRNRIEEVTGHRFNFVLINRWEHQFSSRKQKYLNFLLQNYEVKILACEHYVTRPLSLNSILTMLQEMWSCTMVMSSLAEWSSTPSSGCGFESWSWYSSPWASHFIFSLYPG